MVCSSRILEGAKEDIREIARYLVAVSDGPAAAASFLQELREKISLACEVPGSFPFAPMPELAMLGYQTIHVKNYVALFFVEDGVLMVVHVFHQRQNYARFVLAHHRDKRS